MAGPEGGFGRAANILGLGAALGSGAAVSGAEAAASGAAVSGAATAGSGDALSSAVSAGSGSGSAASGATGSGAAGASATITSATSADSLSGTTASMLGSVASAPGVLALSVTAQPFVSVVTVSVLIGSAGATPSAPFPPAAILSTISIPELTVPKIE